jgi:hypothetical protein
MVIVKATKESEQNVMPDQKMLAEMGKYNEELAKAGVLLDLSGLKSSSHGARVRFSGNKRTVIDGPFPETKELIAGFWILETKTLEECIEWVKRAPNPYLAEGEVEIRPFFELTDFNMTQELIDQAKSTAEKIVAKHPNSPARA